MSINSNRLNDWKDFVMTRLTIDAAQQLTFCERISCREPEISRYCNNESKLPATI